MSAKIAIAEMRLGKIVSEARQFAHELRELQMAITKQYQEMPRSMKKAHTDLLEVLQKTDELRRKLNKEIHDAQTAQHHIHGHRKWKEAVFEIFGQEGLQKCFDYMAQQNESDGEK